MRGGPFRDRIAAILDRPIRAERKVAGLGAADPAAQVPIPREAEQGDAPGHPAGVLQPAMAQALAGVAGPLAPRAAAPLARPPDRSCRCIR